MKAIGRKVAQIYFAVFKSRRSEVPEEGLNNNREVFAALIPARVDQDVRVVLVLIEQELELDLFAEGLGKGGAWTHNAVDGRAYEASIQVLDIGHIDHRNQVDECFGQLAVKQVQGVA